MPLGSKSGATPPGKGSDGKPVVFQKYFKSGNRTYASQVKISQIGKRYLVLTEGHRDPETQELKKHTLCVFEQDLKPFFAILQETAVYLRSNKAPATAEPASPASAEAAEPGAGGAGRPARPPIAVKSAAGGNGVARPAPAARQPAPAKGTAKPAPAARPAPHSAPRATAARPQAASPAQPAPKAAYRTGARNSGR